MLHWVRCLDTSILPSAAADLSGPNQTHPPASERMTRLMQVRQKAQRTKRMAALILPVLLGLGSWSAASDAQAGNVAWSVGVGVPGVVVSAGTPYPAVVGWPVAQVAHMPPRVVYVPQPAWGWQDDRYRHPHHGHHGHRRHGHHDEYSRYGASPPAFGSRWDRHPPHHGGYDHR